MPTFMPNGESRAVDLPPDVPLLCALRDVLGLSGTKHRRSRTRSTRATGVHLRTLPLAGTKLSA